MGALGGGRQRQAMARRAHRAVVLGATWAVASGCGDNRQSAVCRKGALVRVGARSGQCARQLHSIVFVCLFAERDDPPNGRQFEIGSQAATALPCPAQPSSARRDTGRAFR